MNNKENALDIYLMGIGGTGMGAFAGLLKQKGHRVFGSDSAVYSPMREKLMEWGIEFKTPYQAENVPETCDLVIIGNVIRKDNPEALAVREKKLPHDSFPSALNKLFLQQATSIVASGTHGKTTCSSLLAHTLFDAGMDPGFLIGGIPLNFGQSFKASSLDSYPFVVEGDEYDSAFFDKRPKFIHYNPKFLLVTSVEFDHGDIYADLDAVIDAFASLMKTMTPDEMIVINATDDNIKTALSRAQCQAKIVSYGSKGSYEAINRRYDRSGVHFCVLFDGNELGLISLPLFGDHNIGNALGCYAILHQYGLTHAQIAQGYKSFRGVKRRLEERVKRGDVIVVEDFAHHPSAVKETIKAARMKYPDHKICCVFEPRSATSCTKVFEQPYEHAFLEADEVLFAPIGRNLPEHDRLSTEKIAQFLIEHGRSSLAFSSYEELRNELAVSRPGYVLLFMSNGDFQGLLKDLDKIFL